MINGVPVHAATFFHPDYTVGVGLAGCPAHRTPASRAHAPSARGLTTGLQTTL